MALDHHVETIGIDVRPPIEIRTERLKIQDFYNRVSEDFPKLFESLVQGPQEFRIQKTIPIPGKGQVDIATFTITPRGPVFVLPRILPNFDEDFVWAADLNADVIKCLGLLREFLPTLKVLRIGKVRELVFGTGGDDSDAIIRERFGEAIPRNSEGLTVGWNEADEQYNRKVVLNAVRKHSVVIRSAGRIGTEHPEPKDEFGIKAVLDINNRRLDKHLEADELKIILDHADSWYEDRFLDRLNGDG
jgi:hypothetical protein